MQIKIILGHSPNIAAIVYYILIYREYNKLSGQPILRHQIQRSKKQKPGPKSEA